MKLKQILESSEKEIEQGIEDTGFCGKKGAGAIILSESSGKILLSYRSAKVLEPHTWGGWGGAMDDGKETPLQGAKREVTEELGKIDIIKSAPLYVFLDKESNFKYYNFLFVVSEEFVPKPKKGFAWETEDYRWVKFGDWPKPLHFGLKALFADKDSVKKIKGVIAKLDEVE